MATGLCQVFTHYHVIAVGYHAWNTWLRLPVMSVDKSLGTYKHDLKHKVKDNTWCVLLGNLTSCSAKVANKLFCTGDFGVDM